MSARIRLAAAAAVAALTVTAPADAATPGCVTDLEFANSDPGQLKPVVHNIYDTNGWQATASHSLDYYHQIRTYHMCDGAHGRYVQVHYRDYKGGEDVWRAYDMWRVR